MAETQTAKRRRIQPVDNLFDAKNAINASHTSELVIALCGPIGSPLHRVAQAFKGLLSKDFGYNSCSIIKLSALIEAHSGSVPSTPSFDRVKTLIEKGDELREKYGPGVLAELAVSQIALERQKAKSKAGDAGFVPRRVCHIIDSVKNQEELELLRLVYRDMVYFVGVYSPLPRRVQTLEASGMNLQQIYQLIDQDSGEEFNYGQTVRDTFPNSDCFLRIDTDTDSQIEARVERFIKLVLGTNVVTPTRSETAMYLAASAAGNSACLSRQVGAALTDSTGDVVSVGWNDVPRANGGLYMSDPKSDPNSDADHRCWNLHEGTCFNDREKNIIVETVVAELVRSNIISEEKRKQTTATIKENSKLKSLIEFSRAVHAEMHAIINAGSMAGSKISGGKLFVTTYPCHACARHIVAAGIKEVYYIEPYRKSLATRLHNDSITEDENDASRVRILPYDGVAPSRYLKLFRMLPNSRKNAGHMKKVDPSNSQPRFDKTLEALPALEAMVVQGLKDKNLLPEGER
jgi:deoxycytidylate deaminase